MTQILYILRTLATLIVLLMALAPTTRAQVGDAPDLGVGFGEGISFRTLATGTDRGSLTLEGYLFSQGRELSLDRVPLDPGEAIHGRDQGGFEGQMMFTSHLLYVTSGEPTVVRGDDTIYSPGESVMMSDGDYEIRNDTEACVTLLRLRVKETGSFGGAATAPDTRTNLPTACGEESTLAHGVGAAPLGSGTIFIAEVHWESGAGAEFPYGHPGPVSLWVETGMVTVEEITDGTVDHVPEAVDAGNFIPIENYRPYRLWNSSGDLTTALMFGVVETAQGLWADPHYSAGGYLLSWDAASWQAIDWHPSTPYSDTLQLTNGITTVTFESFDIESGVDQCIFTHLIRFRGDFDNSEFEVRDDLPSGPVTAIDRPAAYQMLTYWHEDPAGREEQRAITIECRGVRRPGSQGLVIIAEFPLEAQESEFQAIDELLAGLVFVLQ